jgi:hypothetical protein
MVNLQGKKRGWSRACRSEDKPAVGPLAGILTLWPRCGRPLVQRVRGTDFEGPLDLAAETPRV